MDNKNEMIETNQSLDTLIANSIDLIQYARQLGAAYDILFPWQMDCRGTAGRAGAYSIWEKGYKSFV